MRVPGRRFSQIILGGIAVVFTIMLLIAWTQTGSFAFLGFLCFAYFVLYLIARVAIHCDLSDDNLLCFTAFTNKVIPLNTIRKISIEPPKTGTITIHHDGGRTKLHQRVNQNCVVVRSIIDQYPEIEFWDPAQVMS